MPLTLAEIPGSKNILPNSANIQLSNEPVERRADSGPRDDPHKTHKIGLKCKSYHPTAVGIRLPQSRRQPEGAQNKPLAH
ncbi:uncharacterized protein TrAFT101_009910 [Trichoderma asperellum]|uniref:uncharacterized protein n=1 Tax=Trichoderma asperellum TaxID=101201 RepID=UPI00332386BF|nr:hypothetical protein TrAFT101_009910 [Trichoderma asperellum]